MSDIIEVNITSLSDDIGNLTSCISTIKNDMTKMFDIIKNLDTMWSGPAHTAFEQQFTLDHQSLTEMCDVIDDIIESMENAKTEYIKCESSVANEINSIQIRG